MFSWVAISVVLALTSDKPADYMSAIGSTCLAVAAYFSGAVAKMMGVVANARHHQFGNKAVTIASAPFTDLCFALALAAVGTLTAPSILNSLGSAGAGVACSMLLGAIGLCIVAIMPTAYRLSASSPQL
jgi:hypothetical protein